MKIYTKKIIMFIVVIFIFTGCSFFTSTLEKPKEHSQIKIKQPINLKYIEDLDSEISYVSDDYFLYFSNGWDENQNIFANIYGCSLFGNSEHLITLENVYIDKIIYFNNQFFVLVRKDIYYESDRILICLNQNWSEVWRYEIEGEVLDIYALDNIIALTTTTINAEILEERIIFINMEGKVQNSKILDKYEKVMYMSYMEKEDNIFVITYKSESIYAPCELQKWTKDMKLISKIDLPFMPMDEEIEYITDFEDKILLITDENIYTIKGQDVSKRVDIYSLYKKYMKKDVFLYKNLFINLPAKKYSYLAILRNEKLDDIALFISFNDDFTNASLRYLDINNYNTLCAFEAEDGKLTVITRNQESNDGVLDIYQW